MRAINAADRMRRARPGTAGPGGRRSSDASSSPSSRFMAAQNGSSSSSSNANALDAGGGGGGGQFDGQSEGNQNANPNDSSGNPNANSGKQKKSSASAKSTPGPPSSTKKRRPQSAAAGCSPNMIARAAAQKFGESFGNTGGGNMSWNPNGMNGNGVNGNYQHDSWVGYVNTNIPQFQGGNSGGNNANSGASSSSNAIPGNNFVGSVNGGWGGSNVANGSGNANPSDPSSSSSFWQNQNAVPNQNGDGTYPPQNNGDQQMENANGNWNAEQPNILTLNPADGAVPGVRPGKFVNQNMQNQNLQNQNFNHNPNGFFPSGYDPNQNPQNNNFTYPPQNPNQMPPNQIPPNMNQQQQYQQPQYQQQQQNQQNLNQQFPKGTTPTANVDGDKVLWDEIKPNIKDMLPDKDSKPGLLKKASKQDLAKRVLQLENMLDVQREEYCNRVERWDQLLGGGPGSGKGGKDDLRPHTATPYANRPIRYGSTAPTRELFGTPYSNASGRTPSIGQSGGSGPGSSSGLRPHAVVQNSLKSQLKSLEDYVDEMDKRDEERRKSSKKGGRNKNDGGGERPKSKSEKHKDRRDQLKWVPGMKRCGSASAARAGSAVGKQGNSRASSAARSWSAVGGGPNNIGPTAAHQKLISASCKSQKEKARPKKQLNRRRTTEDDNGDAEEEVIVPHGMVPENMVPDPLDNAEGGNADGGNHNGFNDGNGVNGGDFMENNNNGQNNNFWRGECWQDNGNSGDNSGNGNNNNMNSQIPPNGAMTIVNERQESPQMADNQLHIVSVGAEAGDSSAVSSNVGTPSSNIGNQGSPIGSAHNGGLSQMEVGGGGQMIQMTPNQNVNQVINQNVNQGFGVSGNVNQVGEQTSNANQNQAFDTSRMEGEHMHTPSPRGKSGNAGGKGNSAGKANRTAGNVPNWNFSDRKNNVGDMSALNMTQMTENNNPLNTTNNNPLNTTNNMIDISAILDRKSPSPGKVSRDPSPGKSREASRSRDPSRSREASRGRNENRNVSSSPNRTANRNDNPSRSPDASENQKPTEPSNSPYATDYKSPMRGRSHARPSGSSNNGNRVREKRAARPVQDLNPNNLGKDLKRRGSSFSPEQRRGNSRSVTPSRGVNITPGRGATGNTPGKEWDSNTNINNNNRNNNNRGTSANRGRSASPPKNKDFVHGLSPNKQILHLQKRQQTLFMEANHNSMKQQNLKIDTEMNSPVGLGGPNSQNSSKFGEHSVAGASVKGNNSLSGISAKEERMIKKNTTLMTADVDSDDDRAARNRSRTNSPSRSMSPNRGGSQSPNRRPFSASKANTQYAPPGGAGGASPRAGFVNGGNPPGTFGTRPGTAPGSGIRRPNFPAPFPKENETEKAIQSLHVKFQRVFEENAVLIKEKEELKKQLAEVFQSDSGNTAAELIKVSQEKKILRKQLHIMQEQNGKLVNKCRLYSTQMTENEMFLKQALSEVEVFKQVTVELQQQNLAMTESPEMKLIENKLFKFQKGLREKTDRMEENNEKHQKEVDEIYRRVDEVNKKVDQLFEITSQLKKDREEAGKLLKVGKERIHECKTTLKFIHDEFSVMKRANQSAIGSYKKLLDRQDEESMQLSHQREKYVHILEELVGNNLWYKKENEEIKITNDRLQKENTELIESLMAYLMLNQNSDLVKGKAKDALNPLCSTAQQKRIPGPEDNPPSDSDEEKESLARKQYPLNEPVDLPQPPPGTILPYKKEGEPPILLGKTQLGGSKR